MVTRDDVARRAGTSAAVVSYVVNNGPRPVSKATRERVERAILETGYQPNGLARALRGQRSLIIGLVVPDSSNPFFAELAQVIETECYRRGYYLLLGNSAEDDGRESGYVRAFLEHRVRGLILVSAAAQRKLATETVKALSGSTVPLVLVDRSHSVPGASVLVVDNQQGARLAASHLLYDHEAPEVACLAGPKGMAVSEQRIRGWRAALAAANILPRDDLLRHSSFNRAHACDVALAWLQEPHPPTALFTATDEQALGVLAAASKLKIRVPSDLAVVSFDGTPQAEYTTPRLTTVEQPLVDMGRRAVDLILREQTVPSGHVERFQTRLVVRGSCGCSEDSWSRAGAYERVQVSTGEVDT